MKKLPMLWVPLKETEPVDWSSVLRQFIINSYGSFDEYLEDVTEFNKLRNEVIGCNHDSVGVVFYSRYYVQLENLEQRTAIREGYGLNVQFTWLNGFNRGVKVSQKSVAFEKASVLFNYGALLSEVAGNQYSHGVDEVEDESQSFKNALNSYQKAAGLFQFESENFLHAPTDDLNQMTVRFLSKLMLAQAQEVFSLNIVINKSAKPNYSLLAKLFQSTGNFYKAARDLAGSLAKDSLWPSSYNNWINIINVKARYFEGLANYYQSLLLSSSNKYGESIGYMKSAIEVLSEIRSQPLAPKSSEFESTQNFLECKEIVKELLEQLNEELILLEKDNDFIYHDSVPQKFSLTPIKPMDAVKPSRLEDQLSVGHVLLFENIIPLKIHEYSSMYSEEKAKRLRQIDENIQVANESLESFVEYHNLPKSLNEVKSVLHAKADGGIDYKEFYKSAVRPLVKVVSSGKTFDFQYLSDQLSDSLKVVRDSEDLLRADEEKYLKYKAKYGGLWTVRDSNIEFKERLIQAKKDLLVSEDNDKSISKDFAKIQVLYNLLLNSASSSNQEIRNILEPQEASSLIDMNESDDKVPETLETLMTDLDNQYGNLFQLKKQVIKIFNDYKVLVHEDDISNILVAHKGLPEDQIKSVIFSDQLKKFEPYESRIGKILHTEHSIMNKFKLDYSKLLASPIVKTKKEELKKRHGKTYKMYENLKHFEDNYQKLQLGYTKASDFYKTLLGNLHNLHVTIVSYIKSREYEMQAFAESLDNGSNSGSIHDSLNRLNLSSSSIPTTITTNNNIYSSDIANKNKHSSISTTNWNQAPLIPKKSSTLDPISSPQSSYFQQPPPPPPLPHLALTPPPVPAAPPTQYAPQYGYQYTPQYTGQNPPQYGNATGAPAPPAPPPAPNVPQQTGIPFYNTPSNFDNSMYSKFNENN